MRQTFLMMVGFSRSGKSTLAKNIVERFPDFSRFDSDSIHAFLNSTYSIFQDDMSVDGKAYELRQKATKAIHEALLGVFLTEGKSVLLDAANLAREKRTKVFSVVRRVSPEIRTVIVYNMVPEEMVLDALRHDDDELVRQGKKAVWMDLYVKVQKPKFEAPTADEVDALFTYTRETEQEFFDKLKNVLE